MPMLILHETESSCGTPKHHVVCPFHHWAAVKVVGPYFSGYRCVSVECRASVTEHSIVRFDLFKGTDRGSEGNFVQFEEK